MAIVFPSGLDNFTNPTPANNLNTPTVLHTDQHSDLNDAVEALEAKVGTDGSLVTGSFDYRISYVSSVTSGLVSGTHSPVTLGIANGLSLSGQALSMGLASATATGTLSAADWVIFNSKQSALSFPLVTSLGGTGINNSGTFTNQSNSVITGGGTVALGGFTLTVPATLTVAGLAIANIFTAKQTITTIGQDGHLALINTTAGAGQQSRINFGNDVNSSLSNGGGALFYTSSGYGSGYDSTVGFWNYQSGGKIIFATGNTPRLYILGDGTIGVNTENPKNTFQVDGILKVSTGVHTTGEIALGNGDITGAYVGMYRGTSGGTSGGAVLNLAGYDGITFTASAGAFGSQDVRHIIPVGTAEIATLPTTTTNAILETMRLQATVSTGATGGANGFGAGLTWYAETATDETYQQQGLISTSWIDATNATRKAKMSLSAYDTAARLGIEIDADGSAVKLGFFGHATALQPAAYTPTNVTTDRSYDANSTSIDEIADVLGTLIADLQSSGLVA